MRTTLLPILLLAACQSSRNWSNEEALAAVKLELQVDRKGKWTEIEYHIPPGQVPEAVRDAMNKLHPGGTVTGAEKEWNEGVLYFELTKTIGGRELEAMFLPDGNLHQEEIEVPAKDVPGPVQQAVRQAGGTVDKWEEIRDKDRTIIEYHAKVKRGGGRYKVMVGTDGQVRETVREIPAEVEVPE